MPLATILRPETLDDIIGQQHLVGPGKPIRMMVEKDAIKSMLLHGPSGIGKTTIARCLSYDSACEFVELNATNSKIADIRKTIDKAAARKKSGTTTVAFVDEIHRWAKNIQDALLPAVEDGTLVLVGSTTEKPAFAINSALFSRLQSFQLYQLTHKDMMVALVKAIGYYKNNGKSIKFGKEAALKLIKRCSGDIRKLITTVETIVEVLMKDDGEVDPDLIDIAMPDKFFFFDHSGNEHFDLAAVWQNSIQNSDADQAIYFLAKWLLSGEDPVYIARRVLISASEDACLNPNAAMIANNAYIAAKEIGMPECAILLSHATIEIAKSPRNKIANDAIADAIKDVEFGVDIVDLKEMGAGKHDGYTKLITKKYVRD